MKMFGLVLMVAVLTGTPVYTAAEELEGFSVVIDKGDPTNPIEVAYSVTLTLEGAEETFANQIVGCRDHPASPEWDMVFIGENLKKQISLEEARRLLDQAIRSWPRPQTPRSPERGVFLLDVLGRGLEPPCLAAPAPKAGTSTNFATPACPA